MVSLKQPEKDTWQAFTSRITQDSDLDPGYTAIFESNLSQVVKERTAVAWCAFYNLGIAAAAASKPVSQFWPYLFHQFDTAARSSERRHFRGAAGMNALKNWFSRWPRPEQMARRICHNALVYKDIRDAMRDIPLMGNYFIWKWCDLANVLYDVRIDMTGSERYSPDVPQKAIPRMFSSNTTVEEGYARIVKYARSLDIRAHPQHVHPFDIAEAESIACVYKQMLNGYYVYGSRTAKAIKSLNATPSTAGEALKHALLQCSPYDEQTLLEEILPAMEAAKKRVKAENRRKRLTLI